MSPFNAWLITRGMTTLSARMHAHESGALKIAKFLQDHPSVIRVNYPGLSSHPQHALAIQQMRNFGGLLSFQVKNTEQLAERLPTSFSIFHHAVSLGHVRSLICYIDTDEVLHSSFNMSAGQMEQYKEFAGDGLFRISVGLENPDDLCNDLANALGN